MRREYKGKIYKKRGPGIPSVIHAAGNTNTLAQWRLSSAILPRGRISSVSEAVAIKCLIYYISSWSSVCIYNKEFSYIYK